MSTRSGRTPLRRKRLPFCPSKFPLTFFEELARLEPQALDDLWAAPRATFSALSNHDQGWARLAGKPLPICRWLTEEADFRDQANIGFLLRRHVHPALNASLSRWADRWYLNSPWCLAFGLLLLDKGQSISNACGPASLAEALRARAIPFFELLRFTGGVEAFLPVLGEAGIDVPPPADPDFESEAELDARVWQSLRGAPEKRLDRLRPLLKNWLWLFEGDIELFIRFQVRMESESSLAQLLSRTVPRVSQRLHELSDALVIPLRQPLPPGPPAKPLPPGILK